MEERGEDWPFGGPWKCKLSGSPETAAVQAEYNETQLLLGRMCLPSEKEKTPIRRAYPTTVFYK